MRSAAVDLSQQTIEAGGLATHLNRAGQGNARHLLLLHGGGPGADAWSNWQHALADLGDAFDVVAPDLAGFGRTTHPDPPLDGPQEWMELRVRQVIGLLDALDITTTDVVGNSLGGALSLHLVVKHPDRFRRVVLMGSAGTPTPPTPELIKLVSFYDRGTAEAMAELIDDFVAEPEAIGIDPHALARARMADAMRPEVKRSYQAMFPHDPAAMRKLVLPDEAIAAIRHSVLLIHGRDDLMIPLAASLRLLDRLADVELHVFGRCGHWAMLERRERFAEVVRQFLDAGERG